MKLVNSLHRISARQRCTCCRTWRSSRAGDRCSRCCAGRLPHGALSRRVSHRVQPQSVQSCTTCQTRPTRAWCDRGAPAGAGGPRWCSRYAPVHSHMGHSAREYSPGYTGGWASGVRNQRGAHVSRRRSRSCACPAHALHTVEAGLMNIGVLHDKSPEARTPGAAPRSCAAPPARASPHLGIFCSCARPPRT